MTTHWQSLRSNRWPASEWTIWDGLAATAAHVPRSRCHWALDPNMILVPPAIAADSDRISAEYPTAQRLYSLFGLPVLSSVRLPFAPLRELQYREPVWTIEQAP